jgi:biopolymer transport protein ExbD
MAEVDTGGGGGKGKHGGGPKQKKKSTRIDMTAMVDVAFLLLTFFILTTTLATPQALQVDKPPKTEDDANMQEIAESKIMTMVLGAADQVYYWTGTKEPVIRNVGYDEEGLRKMVLEHLNKFPNRCQGKNDKVGCWDPIFVIKPMKTCRYKNLVDVLDEMKINKIPKYALADIVPGDSTLLADNNLK